MLAAIVFWVFITMPFTVKSVISTSDYFTVVKQSDGSLTCPSHLTFFISFPSTLPTGSFSRIRCADICTSYTKCTGYMLYLGFTQCALFDYITDNYSVVKGCISYYRVNQYMFIVGYTNIVLKLYKSIMIV